MNVPSDSSVAWNIATRWPFTQAMSPAWKVTATFNVKNVVNEGIEIEWRIYTEVESIYPRDNED